MTQDFTGLSQAIAFQRGACAHLGSSFSARLLAILGEAIAAGGPWADLAAPWRESDVAAAASDAAPLRFLGGLHYLVLSGAAPDLARLYPGGEGEADEAELARWVGLAARDHGPFLARFFESPPQTNEVRRAICLVGGFLTVARETGLPLRCLEIGASAGLLQNWDRYHYRFGAAVWGEPANGVEIDAAWSGKTPPLGPVIVAERRGCDQRPIDVADPDQALRLQAYVWPDQSDRLARLRAAIALANRFPPRLDRADAAEWVEHNLAPLTGVATILHHSVVWQYLTPPTRDRVTAAVEAAGAAATLDSPLAWLRMEPDWKNLSGPMEILLTQWPSRREILLARVHPHGAEVDWLGEQPA